MSNHFHATLRFQHGNVKVEGTIIFVLALIADLENREGWISTTRSRELEEQLEANAVHRQD